MNHSQKPEDFMPQLRPQTLAVRLGHDRRHPGEPVADVIVTASSYAMLPGDGAASHEKLNGDGPHFYTRWSNPTLRELELRLAALEGAEDGLVFASGMAAISTLFLLHLNAGDRLVLAKPCYAGTNAFVHTVLPRLGIEVVQVDATDLEVMAAAVTPGTKLVHIETPANPMLGLVDIKAVADIAHKAGAKLVVDSTFASPVLSQPLKFGADFVVHSLTKYICGHGDALGGAVLGRRADMIELRRNGLAHLGGCMDPMGAWRILRGLETLHARMVQHSNNAMVLAQYLEGRSDVARVLYPGLKSHPQHELAQVQMTGGFSGMIAFALKGCPERALLVAKRFKIIEHAVSLGKTKSLMFYASPADLKDVWAGPGQEDGIFGQYGLWRFSVGLEAPEDLIWDLEQALAD